MGLRRRALTGLMPLLVAFVMPGAAAAGTVRLAAAGVGVSDAAVDESTGALLLAWSVPGAGEDAVRFCRVASPGAACAPVSVGTAEATAVRIVSVSASDLRVVVLTDSSSPSLRSWGSTNAGATWGSPNDQTLTTGSRTALSDPADVGGAAAFRTDQGAFVINPSTGALIRQVTWPGTVTARRPQLVSTGGRLVALGSSYTTSTVQAHVLTGVFADPTAWTASTRTFPGLEWSGASLVGTASSTGPAPALVVPWDGPGGPTIDAAELGAGSDWPFGTAAALPGGPFGAYEPDNQAVAGASRAGRTQVVAWSGCRCGGAADRYDRIRYAVRQDGGAWSAASAAYGPEFPNVTASSVEAVTDDAGHRFMTWTDAGGGLRYVELTAVADPPPPAPPVAPPPAPPAKPPVSPPPPATPPATVPANPSVSVRVPGGRLRLTITGARAVAGKRCLVSGRQVTLKVTLTSGAKPKIRRVRFRVDRKLRATDRRAPFAKRLKVTRRAKATSAQLRADVTLRRGSRSSTVRLKKAVRFCR